MPRLTKEETHKNIHEQALIEFDIIMSAVREERKKCLEDRRFYSIAGAQWEGWTGEQFANKPKLEFNKIHLSVIRIINEYRNNRITVEFVPKDGSEDQLSDLCNGLYRADEQDSSAEEARDNAYEEAVAGGFGAYRLCACYEDEEDEDNDRMRVKFEPLFDAESTVFFDLGAKRQDKSDAKRCFVLTAYTHDDYEAEYGDDPSTWDRAISNVEFDWVTNDVVYVAEYYKVETTRQLVHWYRGLDEDEEDRRVTQEELDADPMLATQLASTGYREVRQKRVKRTRVHKYILSGSKVLEDCGYIPGKHIPIVPVYGKRWYVDGIERCMGHVRLAKDAQRLKNIQLSKLAELSSKSSVEKPILTPEQVAGHVHMWETDDVKDHPYLLINQTTDQNGNTVGLPPVGYTKAPQIPPAMAALVQQTELDMKEILGNQEQGDQLPPNTTGPVVEMIQTRLDGQGYIYMSNMAKAVRRDGQIWQSIVQDILVEKGRKMKTINNQGVASTAELKVLKADPETGKARTENDLSKLNHDVYVDIGPSSSSKRAATVRALTQMMAITTDPETLQVLSAMTMMNMEGEGVSEARDYFRQKLLRIGVVKPTPEEEAELEAEKANAKPSANDQYLQAAAQESMAKSDSARADTVLKMAKVDETHAHTKQILSEIGANNDDSSS